MATISEKPVLGTQKIKIKEPKHTTTKPSNLKGEQQERRNSGCQKLALDHEHSVHFLGNQPGTSPHRRANRNTW